MNEPMKLRELHRQFGMTTPACKREGRDIVLDTGIGSYRYAIHADRCATPGAVVHWVMHLSEKNWVTSRHLRQFIECAYAANNLGSPWEAK